MDFPHSDHDALVNSLLPFVQSLVREHGEFHPVGAVVDFDGGIQWIAAESGEEFPEGQKVIQILKQLIATKAVALEIRSAAICYDCLTIPPGHQAKTDAIAFDLESYSGESIRIFVPYVKRDEYIQFGAMFATPKGIQFFPPSTHPH